MNKKRKIVHIDMDAFYAAIEQRDRPELKGQPVVVGGSSGRGVVSTCSYEARAYGVHSAMPAARARKLCPHAIFVPTNMRKYKEESEKIHKIFYKYTDLVEPLSIDEAFLDVTQNHKNEKSATYLAQDLQKEIYKQTGLTASAGVSYNKFLAKVASGLKKPSGLSVITPKNAQKFLDDLPVEEFYGIGRVTAKKMHKMNIRYGRDLKKLDLSTLVFHFGKSGIFFYNTVRGIDERPVEVTEECKSVGRENTYSTDIKSLRQIRIHIRALSNRVEKDLAHEGLAGRTITLKIRYDDFETVTRSVTVQNPISEANKISEIALELLTRTEAGKRKVRLIGVTVSNFPTEEQDFIQLEFDFALDYNRDSNFLQQFDS